MTAGAKSPQSAGPKGLRGSGEGKCRAATTCVQRGPRWLGSMPTFRRFFLEPLLPEGWQIPGGAPISSAGRTLRSY